MTLRTRLHMASAGLILLVVLGMMASLYLSEKKRLWSEIREQQAEDLGKLAKVCDESLVGQDELLLINYVKTLVLSPKVAYAGFVEPSGSGWTFSRFSEKLALTDSSDENVQAIVEYRKLLRREIRLNGAEIIELSQPVGDRGFVRLGYSKDVVVGDFRRVLSQSFQRFAVAAVIAILFGLLLARLFADALSKPIFMLMEGAEAIAKGQKNVRVAEIGTGEDELGRLTKTFNHMSGELAKLDQMKDDFMSHVTHELRSPLTSIIATVELLAEMPLMEKDPKFKRSIDRLIFGSERLNKLVDNILDLTRLEAGKMAFDIQPVNIGTLAAEMADFFVPRAAEKGLTVKSAVAMDLPLVLCDSEKIRQVFSNLIYNAIKFTNTGGITLTARSTADRKFLEVAVEDTGVGIPKDKLDKVFQKFETLKETRDRVNKPVPGSGLGLNIVQNSIKAQGGSIWVESELDKGARFIFTLPIASAQSLAPELPKAAGRQPMIMSDANRKVS